MGALNESKAVAGNAINTLTILGWAKTPQGKPLSVSFTRQEPPQVVPVQLAWRGEVLPNGPPARPLSKLPPPGSSELVATVDDIIGEGRRGVVFGLQSRRMTSTQDPSIKLLYPQPPHLPALAIKIVEADHHDELQNEAAMYNEMEILQGVSIPRFYGLFTVELDADTVIPSLPVKASVKTNESRTRRLSVILIEKLGNLLPLGDKIPEEGDLWDVFRDLARLGIEQGEIRYSNILQAPTSSTSLPGQICPFHGCVHTYRIIDFDSARKNDLTLKRHYYNTLGYLGPILDNMKNKVIVEPWDIKQHNENRSTAM